MDALVAHLLRGRLAPRPPREAPRRPRPTSGTRPRGRAAGDLDQRPLTARVAQRPDPAREEHEALFGDRDRPAAEALERRVGDRAAAERRPAGGGGADRVDDEVEPTQLLAGARER